MKISHWAFGLAAISLSALCFISSGAQADDAAVSDDTEASAPQATADDIPRLIEELDANRFSRRQAASVQLEGLGKAAFPALEQAAQGESREAAERAIDIFKHYYEGENEELKQAAKEALERVSQGNQPAAAQRAREVLNKQMPGGNQADAAPALPQRILPGQIQGRVQVQIGRIQIGADGGNQTIKISEENGVRTVEATEGKRTVKIVESEADGIKMTVKEPAQGENGEEGEMETKSYEAKDAADLENNHPKAYELYKKYREGGADIQGIQRIRGIQVRPFGGRAVPVPVPIQPGIPAQILPGAPQLVPAVPVQPAEPAPADELGDARRLLEEAKGRLEKLELEGNAKDEVKKALEEIEKARGYIEDATKQAANARGRWPMPELRFPIEELQAIPAMGVEAEVIEQIVKEAFEEAFGEQHRNGRGLRLRGVRDIEELQRKLEEHMKQQFPE